LEPPAAYVTRSEQYLAQNPHGYKRHSSTGLAFLENV
jgi:hypothetical protein